MTESEMLKEADRILCEARSAIGKILIERERGMGYFHAEVDWLIDERENINTLIKAIRSKNLPEKHVALPDVLTQEYGDSAQYVEGWNECREVMAGMMK
jgi:hypothetical protein